jgi:RNA-binding protein NOB1
MRVEEVRRWVLRCHACETVTANTQRVFCPKCGNNALERVEKFTGSDGAEHYGVRNKHVLKGTKYSIPMPKSGRTGKKMEPILREDQLIGRKITKKERELNNISKKTEDVFNCEFSEDKYGEYKHVGDAQKTIISIGGGNVKKNPNERKHVATNRRRK